MEQAGREVPIVWEGRRVRAFVPALLAERDLDLSAPTIARTATAAAEVRHAAAQLTADVEPLARLLLRAEGVASSYIEGISAPVIDVVLAEGKRAADGSGAWVAANLAAVTEAVRSAPAGHLSVDLLCEWHRTLMTGGPIPERHVGVLRDVQGWIGGTDPTNAHLVTPPPDDIDPLLDDLVRYANREDVDPVAQAAVAHAQFEIIHPFVDGNGRIGRLLVAWILTHRLSLLTPPPVSVAIAAEVGGYGSGLVLFRFNQHDPWVSWFADAVSRGGRAQSELIEEVGLLAGRWRERLGARQGRAPRRDAVAWQVLDLMPRHLVLTAPVVANELSVANKTANAALRQLAEAGVLLEYGSVSNGRGHPAKLFVSRELLALAGSQPLR